MTESNVSDAGMKRIEGLFINDRSTYTYYNIHLTSYLRLVFVNNRLYGEYTDSPVGSEWKF